MGVVTRSFTHKVVVNIGDKMNVLDNKEEKVFIELSEKWTKYSEPGVIGKGLQKVTKKVDKVVPQSIKEKFPEMIEKAASAKVISKVIETSGKGFTFLGKELSRKTLSKQRVEKDYKKVTGIDRAFNEMSQARSYDLEKIVTNNKLKKQLTAICEGGITGFFGFWGIPFNIAFSMLMYYRTVQYIALSYGFDALDDPREMEIASEVLINCMNPNIDATASGTGAFIARSMFCTEMTNLASALVSKKTFEEMARKGGAQLFYTQIRALANKAAQKGLEKAGEKGIQNSILRKLLENIGKKLPKQFAGKAVPVFGAFVGAGFDTYYITRIIEGANLQYHKRFLIEKSAMSEN